MFSSFKGSAQTFLPVCTTAIFGQYMTKDGDIFQQKYLMNFLNR